MTSYEKQKRMWWLKSVRDAASERGITLRPTTPGLYAMVGYGSDGSVWVWDEITQECHQVAGEGTVDPAAMPEEVKRGRPKTGF